VIGSHITAKSSLIKIRLETLLHERAIFIFIAFHPVLTWLRNGPSVDSSSDMVSASSPLKIDGNGNRFDTKILTNTNYTRVTSALAGKLQADQFKVGRPCALKQYRLDHIFSHFQES
jgi:hypothetical protein